MSWSLTLTQHFQASSPQCMVFWCYWGLAVTQHPQVSSPRCLACLVLLAVSSCQIQEGSVPDHPIHFGASVAVPWVCSYQLRASSVYQLSGSKRGRHTGLDIRRYLKHLLFKVTPVTETQKETSRMNAQTSRLNVLPTWCRVWRKGCSTFF